MSPLLRACAVALVAVGIGAVWWALPRARSGSRTLLLTGFGSFGIHETNPSWETARALDGALVGDARVVAARLDVTWADAPGQLRAAIRRHRPDLVVCLGVAPGEALRLERVARNRDACPQPDNAGVVRTDQAIREGGPDLIPTRLPVDRLLAALGTAGFGEVVTSDDAGGYLCNHVFYRLLDELDASQVAGFVHVPPLEGPWDAARLEQAVRVILETVVDPQADPQATERSR